MPSTVSRCEASRRQVTLRWLDLQRDLTRCALIERQAFGRPWSRAEFKQHLHGYGIGRVAEDAAGLAGYVIYQITADRPRKIVLLNLAVAARSRRSGVATDLVDDLWIRCMASVSSGSIEADVSEENLGAHLFFRDQGFRCEQILDDGFVLPPHTAYRFVRHWPDPRALAFGISQETMRHSRRGGRRAMDVRKIEDVPVDTVCRLWAFPNKSLMKIAGHEADGTTMAWRARGTRSRFAADTLVVISDAEPAEIDSEERDAERMILAGMSPQDALAQLRASDGCQGR